MMGHFMQSRGRGKDLDLPLLDVLPHGRPCFLSGGSRGLVGRKRLGGEQEEGRRRSLIGV